MKFRSKKDGLFTIAILGINIFLIVIAIYGLRNREMAHHEYWPIIPILAVVSLLFWLFFGTYYQLSKDGIHYQCGPIKGIVNLDQIHEIVKGKTLWVGMRPATSQKGLIIKYSEYDEIYISPKTNDAFITEILKLKADIKITEHKK